MNNVIDKKNDIITCSKKVISKINKNTESNKIDNNKDASLADGYMQYWFSKSCEDIDG